jgi:hypothetical protein
MNIVSRTSILLGANVETLVPQLLENKLLSNWQNLAPTIVNTARILIIVQGIEDDYTAALAALTVAAAKLGLTWRHDDFLTYGDPTINTWMPPLSADDPNLVKPPAALD